MSPEKLQDAIHDYIPLAKHMGVKALRADLQGIQLFAPFEVNRNKMGSAFGGSVNSMLTIAAWSWVFCFLNLHKIRTSLVIHSNETRFLKPVQGDLEAFCSGPSVGAQEKFLKLLEKKGRAGINVTAEMRFSNEICATFQGRFAARR